MDQLINLIVADKDFFMQLGFVVILLAVLLSALKFLLKNIPWYGYGKVIGFALGFLIARAPGALAGLLFGHVFDTVVQPKRKRVYKTSAKERQPVIIEEKTDNLIYIDTLFALAGQLAFASGNVSTLHLNQFHVFIDSLQLNAEEQHVAWEWFQHGQHADFNVLQALFIFIQYYYQYPEKSHLLMQHFIQYAEKIKPLNTAQYAILCKTAYALHFAIENFAHLAPSTTEQAKSKPAKTDEENPYTVLGLTEDATNKEIKWTYRKLVGRYHPDRLMSKDLPEDLIKLATQRTQQIKAAYEKICKERGMT